MAKSKKTQLLTLSLIATLISLIPFLSSSLRSTYLYFIINVLIVFLGVEAGFLSTNARPSNNNTTTTTKLMNSTTNARHVKAHVEEDNDIMKRDNNNNNSKIVVCGDEVKKMIKKCPSSTQSMFFIGDNNESEVVEVEEKVQVNKDGEEDQIVYEEEELFEKAEDFIVNFYKQLKMQREESWNKIHEFEENGLVN